MLILILIIIFSITAENVHEAIRYCRAHFGPFAEERMPEIRRFMGALLYAGDEKRLLSSPYADLLRPSLWQEVQHELVAQYCALIGQPTESPLFVRYIFPIGSFAFHFKILLLFPLFVRVCASSVTAGTLALPTLLKYSQVSNIVEMKDVFRKGDQMKVC